MKRRKKKPRVAKSVHSRQRPEQLPIQEDLTRLRARMFRINVVYGAISLACIGLVLRLAYLQITKSDKFRNEAVTTSVTTIPVLPARGRMYDTNGNLLAYDKPVYSVYYTQVSGVNTTTSEIHQLAKRLAQKFQVSPGTIVNTILTNTATNNYATIRLFKQITNAELAYVGEHGSVLPGISVQVDGVRTYPYGDLAGQVLGYVGPIRQDEQDPYITKLGYQFNQIIGQSGLETEYEKYLQGQVGQQIEDVNATGNLVGQASYDPKPQPGDNVQLTLDGQLQADAQEAVQSAIAKYESQSHQQISDAAAVMIDVKTGGVLAMVSYPYLDPNWFISGYNQHANYINTPGVQQNNAIQNPHYPGSTMKPANMLSGLEAGAITPSYTYYDAPGKMYIGNYGISEDASYGLVDDIKAIAVSDDKFFYNLGLILGKWLGSSGSYGGAPLGGFANLQHWRDTYFIKGIMTLVEGEWRFGLGQLTHIDLPNEQSGSFYIENSQGYQIPLDVPKVEKQLRQTGQYSNEGSPTDLANMAFGQSQQVTPIELAQYVSTIANGGKRLQPHLLENVLPAGMYQNLKHVQVKPVLTFQTKVQANLKINPKYLQIVQQGMYDACNQWYGTAYGSFYNAHYKAAGKTGTAEMYMGGQPINNSVFIGYAPYHHPEIAVAVMVPGAGFGAVTAVPIAKRMMDDYFDEHHASFMPKSQWTGTTIPAAWMKSAAYNEPEKAK